MSEELKGLITGLNTSFDALKKADETKTAELKKYGEESAETKAQITKINDEITKFQAKLDEVAKKANRIITNGEPQITEEQKKAQEAFFKYMRVGKAEMEREEKKLVEDAEGQIIVPQELDNQIYRILPQLNVLRGLSNVRNITSDRIRRVNMNELTVGWGKLETQASPTLSNYESDLNPTEAFAYVENAYGLTKIGEDELDDTNINLEAYLADSFSQAMSDLEESGFLRGTGHTNLQPEGLLSTGAGLTRFDTKTTTFTADDMLSIQYETKAQVSRKGVYLINPKIELAIRLMKDSQGQYLWQPALTAGAPSTFGGKAIHLCSQMDDVTTAGKEVAIFGDFNLGYQILDRQQGFVQRINELYIEAGLIGFKYKRRVGGYVRNKEAFRVLKVKAT